MSTPSQTDWAENKADEILRRLDHQDVAYDTELIAAALRAERERCAQVAESAAPDWHRRMAHDASAGAVYAPSQCGCSECIMAFDIAKIIREGV